MSKAKKQEAVNRHTATMVLEGGEYVVTDVLTGVVLYKGASKSRAETIYGKAMHEYARMAAWGMQA